MSKLRVYELARELNVESKLMVARLKQLGIEVASHQSTLTDAQAAKARKGVAEGASTEAPKTAAAAPVVIRRRRRDGAESEAAEAAQESASAETAEQAAANEAVEEAPVSNAERQQEPTSAEVSAPQASEAKNEPAPQSAASEPVEEKKAQEPTESDARPPRRVAQAGGATIVRKASPEEIAARHRPATREAPQRRFTRTEDTRGPRPGAPPSPANDPLADPALYAEGNERGGFRSKIKDKKEIPQTEEEIAKKLPPKQRRAKNLNVRSLLTEIDDEEEKVPVHPVAKTVYTPASPTRRRDIKRRKDLKKTNITQPRAAYRVVKMGAEITVAEFSKQMAVKAPEVIKKLMAAGIMASINSNIDIDTATLVASDFGFEVKSQVVEYDDIVGLGAEALAKIPQIDRSPIVTVMGHVDHGKTSILDAIRNAEVAAGEAGGITQHIGAYSVTRNGKAVTFIDTPGHEAFSTMRARGANVTDVVILVVAADDGVMPQTVEAISHARAAEVPIIVAINKIDKPNVNFDRIYNELAEHGIQSEEWGGDHQFVKVSALQRTGIEDLLEAILLQAEILELKAPRDMAAEGVVVEAHLDKGRGPVATVLVQRGILRKGDHIVAGVVMGRVRAMADHTGSNLLDAGPSVPVEVIGLSEVPNAGDRVNVVEDEKKAREAAEWRRAHLSAILGEKSSAQSLEDLLAKVKSQSHIEVPMIVKADTQGSVEAIVEAISKLNTDKVSNKIVHKAAGGITESDLSLALASGAVVIGFNVRLGRGLDDVAERKGVVVKYFSIIYEVVDAVKAIMTGSLPPIVREVVIGHAEVRNAISVPRIGTIAGSAVTDGKITRASNMRLVRDDVVIYEGKVGSLRRFKDDVSEVQQGYECGISVDGYSDIREGDVIEAFILEEHAATL